MSKRIGLQSTLKKKKKDEKSSRSYLWLHSVTSKAKLEEAIELLPVSFLGCSTSTPSCQAVKKLRPQGRKGKRVSADSSHRGPDITVCLHVSKEASGSQDLFLLLSTSSPFSSIFAIKLSQRGNEEIARVNRGAWRARVSKVAESDTTGAT